MSGWNKQRLSQHSRWVRYGQKPRVLKHLGRSKESGSPTLLWVGEPDYSSHPFPFSGGWKEGWLCWQTFKKDSPLPTWLPDVACLRTQRGFQSITSRLPISQPTHQCQSWFLGCHRVILSKSGNIVTCTRAQEGRWPSWRIFLVGSRRASRKSSESFSPVRLLLYIIIIWIYWKYVAIR